MDFLSNITIPLAAIASTLLLSILALKIFAGIGPEKKRKKRYHPVAGTLYHQILNFHRLHDYYTDLARKYKTFRLVGIDHNEVYITDPANVEYILKTNFHNYGKGSFHYNRLTDFFGDGIFAVDGAKWRHQRKVASYDFSTRILRVFSSTVFQSNAAKLAHKVSEYTNSNQAMDVQDLFMKSTMDTIFKVAFGIELNTLYGSSKEGNTFSKAFDDSSEVTLWRYVDVFWKMKRFLNIGTESELKRNTKVLDEYVYKLIRRKKEQISCQQNPMKKEDILSRFLELSKDDPKNMNDRYLRDIILNFIIAGKDTTAVTLSWFFYMLCKNPRVQEKVAQEVKVVMEANDKTPINEFATSLTEEAINKMNYLHAALTETLRLYPAVPVDGKFCHSDDTLPDGFDVRRGDTVAYVPYAMGRMKFLWGEDAEVFRPERWLDVNGTFQPESSFKFTAFQAGPRTCLGKEFAYRQMKIFAAVLLRFFTFKLSDENKHVKYRTMLTLHISEALQLLALPREI
ncbi:cytochrome P450 704C1-like [Tasmannia lanceolata]|uniref:cytochrome P450 704C1-like n=1 Tax=Tasmannia lanceolata TaxID=3420 RepID=UPI00406493FE